MSGEWTRAGDIKTQLQRLWERGEILADAVCDEATFPRRLVLKVPTASEMSARFDEVRKWIAEVRGFKNCRIESRVTNHRQLGRNEVPAEIWIDTLDDALAWLGKRGAFKQFRDLVELTRAREPALVGWLRTNSLRALDHAEVWSNLMEVVGWMRCNPRPSIYIREVDLPGVDSKFIEQHKGILSELLDEVLPPDCIDATVSGVSQFARRYGFKSEREKIRFRILDPTCALFDSVDGDQDISLDVDTFAELRLAVRRVFITENKTNFLAFPPVPGSLVIFGAGYGWDALARAHWLFHCDIHYWGDIDTHGFAILNQLRAAFPHVQSLLMDEQTASRFAHLAVEETKPTDSLFDSLTSDESALLERVRAGSLGAKFRLEQERIDWTYARAAIESVVSAPRSPVSSPAPVLISTSDIADYFLPSRCSRRITLLSELALCRRLGQPDPDIPTDPPSELNFLLRDLSTRHRASFLSTIPSLTDLSPIDDPTSRASATLAAITSGAAAIHAPLLTVSTRIAGTAVTIHAEADLLRLTSSNKYDAVNFKVARRIADHPELLLELSLFSWAFDQLTGMHLSSVAIQNPHDPLLSLKPAISDSLRTVADIIRARSLPPDHYVPVGWTKCTACSFRAHCWAQANANRDIALLPEVEQELAIALRRSGVDCIETLLERFDAASLAALQYRSGSKSVRVGKRAESILSSARAFCTNEPVWMPNRPALLPSPTIAIIDFEGLPPLTVPHDYVYLWGMQLFGEDASKYQYSLAPANETDADRSAWFHFLTMCGALIEQNPSIQFVHYHHYEPTMVRKYIERYGDHNSVAARLLERCVDLHALLRESVCLPLASYSLKEVERYLGHSRSQTQCGGDWSIAAFIRAQESDDESLLHEICKYNAEDIAATWFVLQYLRENESRTATAIS